MPSSWIRTRSTKTGERRYRVEFRVGGRESRPRYAGSFATKAEALARKRWVDGELGAMRVPDLGLLDVPRANLPSLREVAERWRLSRVDVSAGTAATHRVNIGRIVRVLGDRSIDAISADEIAAFVVEISALKRESIRKTIATLAMVFDFAGVAPNPARDKRVKLPAEDRPEVNPPSAPHVASVYALIPRAFRLPLLVLDATGMRVGELESLSWGDVDEPGGRWRVSRANAKTKNARWIPVPDGIFEAVVELVPREDRDLSAPVFADFGADRFRTALARASKAAGVPLISPHDLRHRRATLWHLQGVPAVEAASWLGHSAQEHLRTYAHVTVDRTELDYPDLLGHARVVLSPVPPSTI